MHYKIVNLKEWKRAALFQFYMDHMRVVMSLTADIDVLPLIKYSRKNHLKFYPTMIWVVSKAVNAHPEFKYGWDMEGNLVQWDSISPSYAHFHKEDENFTKLTTEYSDDLFAFHKSCMADREKYKDARGFAEGQPPNHFDVSCLPWIKYSHFDLHVFDEGKFLAPVITWGKYQEKQDRAMMPLTMNIHHAVADGFHLCRFFEDVQTIICTFH